MPHYKTQKTVIKETTTTTQQYSKWQETYTETKQYNS